MNGSCHKAKDNNQPIINL